MKIPDSDNVNELRLIDASYGVLIENFVSRNAYRLAEKIEEWEHDYSNLGTIITFYSWVDGERTELWTRGIH